MRVLVASTAGAGHFEPLVPLLDALARAGHERLVVGPPGLAATGHPERRGAAPPERAVRAILDAMATGSREESSVLANRELFGALCTAAMLPAVERACREWRPGLVVREPCEYASAIAAERHGIPQIQVAISLAEVEAGSLELAAPALEPHAPGIAGRLREAPYLTRFPSSLDPSPFPDTRRYREDLGPPGAPLPDWWAGSDAPLVYVTFGSVLGDLADAALTYRAAIEAVGSLPARVLLTVGRTLDPSAAGPLPRNTHVERWVPQRDVLGAAAAVVAHGGSGTTLGALAAGVPLVLVPLFADQPVNAERVAAAGAAVLVEPEQGPAGGLGRIGAETVPRLRAAVEAVLGDAAYARAAGELAAEMRAATPLGALLTCGPGRAAAR